MSFVNMVEQALRDQGYENLREEIAHAEEWAKADDIARPTWGFLASPIDNLDILARHFVVNHINATIMPMVGTWEGLVESGVHILYQGDDPTPVLSALSKLRRLKYVHMLADGVTVDYFDLDTIREGKM